MKQKYPSTPYLDASGSRDPGDRAVSAERLYGVDVVVTEKMDGENTTVYPAGTIHARSTDSRFHPSRSMIAAHAAAWGHTIPQGLRVIVENCYAEHSIRYDELPAVGFVIGVMAGDTNLEWTEVERVAKSLRLPTVPVLFRGGFTPDILTGLIENIDTDRQEGFVVRSAGAFDSMSAIAKWVRPDHVQSDDHWTTTWVPNGILKEA